MDEFDGCEEKIKVKRILIKDSGGKSKIYFNNPNKFIVRKIQIDDCVIKDGIRCDFLLISIDGTEYFIELKGCDIEKAVNQLETTIKKVSQNPTSHPKYSYIVCTRCPLLSPRVQQIRLRFKQLFNSHFVIAKVQHEVTI